MEVVDNRVGSADTSDMALIFFTPIGMGVNGAGNDIKDTSSIKRHPRGAELFIQPCIRNSKLNARNHYISAIRGFKVKLPPAVVAEN